MPLGREVRVADDRRAVPRISARCSRGQLRGARVAEQDQRLLLHAERRRRRPAPPRAAGSARRRARGACAAARRAAAPAARSTRASGARRSRAGCRSRSFAQRSAASGRYSVEPNASSAMNSCGRARSKRSSTCSGRVHSCTSQPSRQQRQPEHPRDRRLAHLRRAGEDEEVVPAQHGDGADARRGWGRTRARARARRRCRTSSARARGSGGAASSESSDGSRSRSSGEAPDRVAAARLRRRRRRPIVGRGVVGERHDRGWTPCGGGDRPRSSRSPEAADQHGRRERPAGERDRPR